jgi:putative DNA methylase
MEPLQCSFGDGEVRSSRFISGVCIIVKVRKKLIEVALPLEAINEAAAREKSIRHGHPNSLHLWWARRPLAAARAVIFAQMVDDPSSVPELFATEAAQEKERARLFQIVAELVKWENTANEAVLQKARDEIWKSWRRASADNEAHPQGAELFDANRLPPFYDPFAGGGALPLEAQRLGFKSFASDLNPVAVLITKALIDIPARFANLPPVNPVVVGDPTLLNRQWRAADGLAEDLEYYGRALRDAAWKQLASLYPEVGVTAAMARERPDLKDLVGRSLTVTAWIWARTVKSPNPAFSNVDVPLASTFFLSTKPGSEAYIEPEVTGTTYRFVVKMGLPRDVGATKRGTKTSQVSFKCLISGSPITSAYIDQQANLGLMGACLMAIVGEGNNRRVYLSPTKEAEDIASGATPSWRPTETSHGTGGSNAIGRRYGFQTFADYFTNRQLTTLATLSNLIGYIRDCVIRDAEATAPLSDQRSLEDGGIGARARADAIAVYLGLLIDQVANHSASVCGWNSVHTGIRSVFSRQAITVPWDFAESNPFSDSSGSYNNLLTLASKAFMTLGTGIPGFACQADAMSEASADARVISTDPPYYDNIGYADLSDFFYVWLRHSLRTIIPELFSTVTTPKASELVAVPYRHGGKEKAEAFFLNGMTQALRNLLKESHPGFPVTIYYAFKQSERTPDNAAASTGWETFLEAVIQAGFTLTGTWPIRTEREGRVRSNDSNALASSIVLVCRPRARNAIIVTRRDFLTQLKQELPKAIGQLQSGNIAPVDLAQASIGPGMAVYTRYSKVVDVAGNAMSVREALACINQTLDEVLSAQEADFDPDTRWALAWFEQFAFADGGYGIAETLSKAKNTSVAGLAGAGILESKQGKVRLLKPEELPRDWHPGTDPRLAAWEVVHHLIRTLADGGESAASDLVAKLGANAEIARELAYRLYAISERKKRTSEALAYNELVQSWPEIIRLARERGKQGPDQPGLF